MSSTNSQKWYFTKRGQQAGPVEWEHLQQLNAAGQLGLDELVWCEGMPEWVPASAVAGLSFKTGDGAATGSPVSNTAAAPAATNGNIPPTTNPYIPQYAMADPYFNLRANETIYAGFWLRMFAALVDGFFVALIMLPILGGFIFLFGVPDPNVPGSISASETMKAYPSAGLILRILMVVVGWLYFAYQESGKRQGTLGKRLLGLVVTDMNGQRISFARASGRHFGKILSQITFAIGYIMAGTTERKQALHDLVSSCLVVIKPE
jgi:uncharacterized RDD family membrane protein YckC